MKLTRIYFKSPDLPTINEHFNNEFIDTKDVLEHESWFVIVSVLNNITKKHPYHTLPPFSHLRIEFEYEFIGKVEQYIISIRKEEEDDDVEEELYMVTDNSLKLVKEEEEFPYGFTSLSRDVLFKLASLNVVVWNENVSKGILNNRIKSLLADIYNTYDQDIHQYVYNFLNKVYNDKFVNYEFKMIRFSTDYKIDIIDKNDPTKVSTIYTLSTEERLVINTLLYLLHNYFRNASSIVLFDPEMSKLVLEAFKTLKLEFLDKNKATQVVFI